MTEDMESWYQPTVSLHQFINKAWVE